LNTSTIRLGVGVTTPSSALDISGVTNGLSRWQMRVAQAYTLSLSTNIADTAYADAWHDAGLYKWQVSGTEKMRLHSNGYLGIGTSSPAVLLHLNGTGGNAQIRITDSGQSGLHLTSAAGTNGFKIGRSLAGTDVNDFFVYDFTSAATRFFIDATGKVGIGTTSPARILELKSAQACMVFNDITNSWTVGTGSFIDGSNSFNFYLGGVGTYLRIDASGNLGLGLGLVPNAGWASSAYRALQLGQRGVIMFYETGASVLNIGNNFYYDGTAYKRLTVDYASQYQQASGAHNWRIAGTGAADSTISWTQAMTLDNGGNLGIGTTSPGDKLDVQSVGSGGININNSTAGGENYLRFRSVGVLKTQITSNYADGNLYFYHGGVNALVITGDGSVAITQAAGKYTIDTTGGATVVNNGGTVDFPSSSGMLVVNCWANGQVTVYLCGGGSTSVVANVSGQVGTFAYNSGIAGYTWTSNFGSASVYGFFFLRTRNTA
jgi:hypothetical protein